MMFILCMFAMMVVIIPSRSVLLFTSFPVRRVIIFFFQAEDGIRDLTVTGVQTCALPICEEIPLTARILQTVDIYDALSTSRPYRKALSSKETFTLMREEVERGWWDGSLVDKLEALVIGSAIPLTGVEAKQ